MSGATGGSGTSAGRTASGTQAKARDRSTLRTVQRLNVQTEPVGGTAAAVGLAQRAAGAAII